MAHDDDDKNHQARHDLVNREIAPLVIKLAEACEKHGMNFCQVIDIGNNCAATSIVMPADLSPNFRAVAMLADMIFHHRIPVEPIMAVLHAFSQMHAAATRPRPVVVPLNLADLAAMMGGQVGEPEGAEPPPPAAPAAPDSPYFSTIFAGAQKPGKA